MKKEHPFIAYKPKTYNEKEILERSREFYLRANERRSIRQFSTRPVATEVIRNIIMTASTAPSGANKQPWTFCVVTNPALKKQIREAAEREEKKNYQERMSKEWLDDLEHLETNWNKEFIEDVPIIIVVFKRIYEIDNGTKHKNYYVNESVGLATGLLIAAIHHAGLASLTYTPSPMDFLAKLLKRPQNERPYLVIPVGYPAEDAIVPDQPRKSAEEVLFSY